MENQSNRHHHTLTKIPGEHMQELHTAGMLGMLVRSVAQDYCQSYRQLEASKVDCPGLN